ncbi:MAG: hypothetical protein NWE78_06135 [Candidatus Bathyarchaeota archaeon]|jgi:hypothetical protein|nr:hypothetical protein [Candidatus Bathyarchaeota archaeon]
MRIVKRRDDARNVDTKKVELGKEDLVIIAVIAFVFIGLGIGQLTIQEALAYFGVSGAGGVWGMLGGITSEK